MKEETKIGGRASAAGERLWGTEKVEVRVMDGKAQRDHRGGTKEHVSHRSGTFARLKGQSRSTRSESCRTNARVAEPRLPGKNC